MQYCYFRLCHCSNQLVPRHQWNTMISTIPTPPPNNSVIVSILLFFVNIIIKKGSHVSQCLTLRDNREIDACRQISLELRGLTARSGALHVQVLHRFPASSDCILTNPTVSQRLLVDCDLCLQVTCCCLFWAAKWQCWIHSRSRSVVWLIFFADEVDVIGYTSNQSDTDDHSSVQSTSSDSGVAMSTSRLTLSEMEII